MFLKKEKNLDRLKSGPEEGENFESNYSSVVPSSKKLSANKETDGNCKILCYMIPEILNI
jgi:hypothetical protein